MSEQPAGELEYRSATQIGVSFPKRSIELIVMPYETETAVPYEGRVVREIVSRGAFDGIERRANRVRVNRDHDVTRTIGRALAFHPSREEGLVAELRIASTVLRSVCTSVRATAEVTHWLVPSAAADRPSRVAANFQIT